MCYILKLIRQKKRALQRDNSVARSNINLSNFVMFFWPNKISFKSKGLIFWIMRSIKTKGRLFE